MKRILLIVFLAISFTSFSQGNWTLSGAKNRWANGIGLGFKDTASYTATSDTNLVVLQYPGYICYRRLTTDHWQVLASTSGGTGYIQNQYGSTLSAQTAKFWVSDTIKTANKVVSPIFQSISNLKINPNYTGNIQIGADSGTTTTRNVTSIGNLRYIDGLGNTYRDTLTVGSTAIQRKVFSGSTQLYGTTQIMTDLKNISTANDSSMVQIYNGSVFMNDAWVTPQNTRIEWSRGGFSNNSIFSMGLDQTYVNGGNPYWYMYGGRGFGNTSGADIISITAKDHYNRTKFAFGSGTVGDSAQGSTFLFRGDDSTTAYFNGGSLVGEYRQSGIKIRMNNRGDSTAFGVRVDNDRMGSYYPLLTRTGGIYQFGIRYDSVAAGANKLLIKNFQTNKDQMQFQYGTTTINDSVVLPAYIKTGTGTGYLKATSGVVSYDNTAFGTGSVTSVSVTTANGVSGSVLSPTTTPAITLTLGAITPTSVSTSGNITAATIAATITTAAQPNITSLGTLSQLTVTGNCLVSGFATVGNLIVSGTSTGVPSVQVSSTTNIGVSATSTLAIGGQFTSQSGSNPGARSTNSGGGPIHQFHNGTSVVSSISNSGDFTGNAATATTAGTVTTASQPNITGVGTITSGTWNAGAVTSSGAGLFSGKLSSGINSVSANMQAEIYGSNGAPVNTGTTQTGILRLSQSSGQSVLDMSINGGNGVYANVTNSSDLSQHYPYVINPFGGNVGIGTGTSVTPASTLEVNGSLAYKTVAPQSVAFSTGATIDNTAQFWTNTNTGSITVTLPTTAGNNKVYTIRYGAIAGGGNTLTVGTTSSQNIINHTTTATTYVMAAGDVIQVQSDGTSWIIIAKN